jgi:hypothetical protein
MRPHISAKGINDVGVVRHADDEHAWIAPEDGRQEGANMSRKNRNSVNTPGGSGPDGEPYYPVRCTPNKFGVSRWEQKGPHGSCELVWYGDDPRNPKQEPNNPDWPTR